MGRAHYIQRINKALDFIETNLDQELTLIDIAHVANFSPYHFHRIFASFIEETLNQFITRVRLERAASYLLIYPNQSILEIAIACGFSSSSSFGRAFKSWFGMSATQWRDQKKTQNSNPGILDSKRDQLNSKLRETESIPSMYIPSMYIDKVTSLPTWRIPMNNQHTLTTTVQVKELPQMNLAYVRHIGPYKGNAHVFKSMITQLMKWAGPRGILENPETQMLCIYHDNPELTDEGKLRISMCLTIPENTPVDGAIGNMTLDGGMYAMARFELGVNDYQDAWNTVYGTWLPESGYEPDDRPCFELYLNDPEQHPEHKSIVEICIPVRPSSL